MENGRQQILKIIVLCAALVLVFQCANRGTPSGGEKDTEPPVVVRSEPENFSVNFIADEIRITFNEYIKVKDLQKQLIISPPMDLQPDITPMGSASKELRIRIYDTLAENTTYAFNFGESIVDNNEENPFPFYRYVFSTGSYIDSLSIKGTVSDALNIEPDTYVSVMLYEVDSAFTDSVIYKQKPKYVASTKDSTYFELENLKAGKYLAVALKEENPNYTFQQKEDKIGYLIDPISVPEDSVIALKTFKEVVDYRAAKPRQSAGQRIAFGYEGDATDMSIHMLSDIPDSFAYRITKLRDRDTLSYWYTPKLEQDSLLFRVANKGVVDTFSIRLRDLEPDTLVVKGSPSGAIGFYEDFFVESSVPVKAVDPTGISFLDADSIPVPYTYDLDTLSNRLKVMFDKKESTLYTLKMLPGTITDWFDQTNDSIVFNLRTRAYADYGNIRLSLENAAYPVIVELVNKQGEVKSSTYETRPRPVDFFFVDPGEYYIRVIYDQNQNGKYDPGRYLDKRLPERVSYYPEPLEIRSGWDEILNFRLSD